MEEQGPSPEILAKVRKLLALGTSPSEAEASSALAKARELLARHGLEVSDIDPREHQVTQEVILEKKRPRTWESYLVHVVAKASYTQALQVRDGQGSRIILVGRSVNIQAAQGLFTYLHRVVLILGRAHSQEVVHLDSFKTGLVHRLGERLLAMNTSGNSTGKPGTKQDTAKDSTSLVVQMDSISQRENHAYINETFGTTTSKRIGRRVEADSYYLGRAKGDGVSLHKQVGDGPHGSPS